KIIDAPLSVGVCILLFMTIAALVSPTGLRTGRGIDPKLQPFRVHIIGQGLHIRKLAIGMYIPLRIALAFPGVIDIHIDVSGISHPARDHSVCRCANIGVIYLLSEMIPAVPAHWRSG